MLCAYSTYETEAQRMSSCFHIRYTLSTFEKVKVADLATRQDSLFAPKKPEQGSF